jgi:hypothetical protein
MCVVQMPFVKSTTVEFGDQFEGVGASDSDISAVQVSDPASPPAQQRAANGENSATLPSEVASEHGAWVRRQTVRPDFLLQRSRWGPAAL